MSGAEFHWRRKARSFGEERVAFPFKLHAPHAHATRIVAAEQDVVTGRLAIRAFGTIGDGAEGASDNMRIGEAAPIAVPVRRETDHPPSPAEQKHVGNLHLAVTLRPKRRRQRVPVNQVPRAHGRDAGAFGFLFRRHRRRVEAEPALRRRVANNDQVAAIHFLFRLRLSLVNIPAGVGPNHRVLRMPTPVREVTACGQTDALASRILAGTPHRVEEVERALVDDGAARPWLQVVQSAGFARSHRQRTLAPMNQVTRHGMADVIRLGRGAFRAGGQALQMKHMHLPAVFHEPGVPHDHAIGPIAKAGSAPGIGRQARL